MTLKSLQDIVVLNAKVLFTFLNVSCLASKFATVSVAEAVVRRCSVKKAFLEISHNSQENTCARFSFLIKLQA